MKKNIFIITALLLLFTHLYSQTSNQFNKFFLDKTMRLDYYHTGVKDQEIISLDAVYEEPACAILDKQLWAGSKINLIDTLNFGKYMVKLFDAKTNQLIYSRGYCSLFGEWQTTDEAAKGIYRTFHESVLFPYPQKKVQVVLYNRDKQNYFYEIFSTIIEPESRFVNREKHNENVKVKKVLENGDPAKKVDLLILGDGYTKKELKKFRQQVDHFVKLFFSEQPYKTRKNDFNVWAIEMPSIDSGIDEPRKNIWRNTAFGCSYNSFDSPRYILTFKNKEIRNIAAAAPYDQIYFLVNSDRYGGGGIFNLFSTCYSHDTGEYSSWWPDYVFVHEFGHAFGGLGDEYYSSSVAYEDFYPQGVDPWEPNVGIIKNGRIKWENLMEKNIPIPTPWEKAKYDSLSAARYKVDKSSPDYREIKHRIGREMEELLKTQQYWGKIGVFQGSGYASEGLYRPYLNCRMFSKSLVGYCPVCRAAIEKMIDFYTK